VISEANDRMLDAVGWGVCHPHGVPAVINEYQTFLYRGGLSLTALVTAELVAVAVHPRAAWCAHPVVAAAALGRRAFVRDLSVHFRFMLTRPQLDVPFDGVLLLATRFALTLGIAALSTVWWNADPQWLWSAWKAGAKPRVWRSAAGLGLGGGDRFPAGCGRNGGGLLLTARRPRRGISCPQIRREFFTMIPFSLKPSAPCRSALRHECHRIVTR